MNAAHAPHRCWAMGPAQRGLGMIAAIVVLVMLSALAAAVTRLTWTQQTSSVQDILGARAFQAAYAGTQWGMYQALKADGVWNGANCTGSQTLDLTDTLGFKVTVTCATQAEPYNEGQDASGHNLAVRLYTIVAVACNGAAPSCPDNANAGLMSYVERKRQAVVSSMAPGL